jgi:hypothetical protein
VPRSKTFRLNYGVFQAVIALNVLDSLPPAP